MVLYVSKTAVQQNVTQRGEGSSELEGTASSLRQREMKRKLKIYIAHSAPDIQAPLVEVISGAAHFLLNRAWRHSLIKRRHLWRPHGDTDINSRKKKQKRRKEPEVRIHFRPSGHLVHGVPLKWRSLWIRLSGCKTGGNEWKLGSWLLCFGGWRKHTGKDRHFC